VSIKTVFGLLYVDRKEQSAVNSRERNFERQIKAYLMNALGLAKSLSIHGLAFELITNDRALLESLLPNETEGFELVIKELNFKMKVPSGTRFYSAHYKLEVFEYIGHLSAGYYAFCDLDMVCLRPLPNSFENLIKRNIPVCYDISDLVLPAYGAEVIANDLSKLTNLESEGRWTGGEFLAGSPGFFKLLVETCYSVLPAYYDNIKTLHHVGDEAITSAALEIIRGSGMYVADGGQLSIVARYWNALVRHPQKSFNYYADAFLLHLPSDKQFLARFAVRDPIDYEGFCGKYRVHLRSLESFLHRCRQLVSKMVKNNIRVST